MGATSIDKWIGGTAKWLFEGHMQRFGIANTMKLSHLYNKLKYGRQDSWRRDLYRSRYEDLLRDNGPTTRPVMKMQDGWAWDDSMSLPHLDRMLEDSEKIIADRAGKGKRPADTYRSFFWDMWTPADCVKYPSFLDFASSSDLLATVGDYLQSVPAISTTLPSGVRFVESNAAYDSDPHRPKDSQLFHIDYYSQPNVYVLVLLRDTTMEMGPWTFIPKARSLEVAQKLGYWKRGCGYRLSDEQVYGHVAKDEVISFVGKRGTVLFIESSGCMHYGSRNSVVPRYQLMLGYTGACRTDPTEAYMPLKSYPKAATDSHLRRMVLDKYLAPYELPAKGLAMLPHPSRVDGPSSPSPSAKPLVHDRTK